MPELPEVETVRKDLESVLVGQTIESVEVLREKSFQGNIRDILNAKIEAVERKAKVLFIKLNNQYLMVHLKMTGQLIYDNDGSDKTRGDRIVGGHPNNSWNNALPDKHTRVILKLSKGTLYFNDQRVFGWVKVVGQAEVDSLREKMPPDIIDEQMNLDLFYQILQSTGRAVKLVILDSHKIGGVGNIYACDGLFAAGIDPRRPAKSLSRSESDLLLASLKQVINRGVELGGATAADGKFVNTQGLGGLYQNEFLVYEQEGKEVERDGVKGVVQKFKLGGRGTYWVPELQH